jgi:hypothetical protein
MKTGKLRRISGLALPLIAVVIVALALAWGHSASQTSEAETTLAEMSLTVKAGGDCAGGVCNVPGNGNFTLSAVVDSLPSTGGYIGFNSFIVFGQDLVYKKRNAADEIVWPLSALAVNGQLDTDGDTVNDAVAHGNATAVLPPFPVSTYTGNVVDLEMNCSAVPSSTQVELLPLGDPIAGPFGAAFKQDPPPDIPAKTTGLEIICGLPDEQINIHVNRLGTGAKQEGTCWRVFYEDPVAGKVEHDVVGDNVAGVKPDCSEPSNLKLSDSDPAGGLLRITITSAQRVELGDIWHVQNSFSPVGKPDGNTYVCDLSLGKCNVPKVAVGGLQTALDPTGSDGSRGLLAGIAAVAITATGVAWFARRRRMR